MKLLFTVFFISLLAGQAGRIPLLPGVTIYAHDVVLAVILMIWGIKLLRVKKSSSLPALFSPVLAFFAVGIISLAVNYSRFDFYTLLQASLYVFRWLGYACIYFVLVQGGLSVSFLFTGLYWFGTGVSLIGFIQYVLYPDLRLLMYLGWDPHYYRLFSTFLDPNFAGIVIVLTLFLGMYLVSQKRNTWFMLGNAVNLIALYLTYSRSSYLAFIIGILVYMCLQKKWKILLVVTAFVCFVIFLPKPGGKTLLLSRMDSTTARIGNWQESLSVIARSPVIGHGFNTLRFIQARGTQVSVAGEVSHAQSGMDSSILFLLATTGVIGAAVYGWLLWTATKLFRTAGTIQSLWISVLTALSVHSLFTNSLFYPWVMIWLWIFLAGAELLINKKKHT